MGLGGKRAKMETKKGNNSVLKVIKSVSFAPTVSSRVLTEFERWVKASVCAVVRASERGQEVKVCYEDFANGKLLTTRGFANLIADLVWEGKLIECEHCSHYTAGLVGGEHAMQDLGSHLQLYGTTRDIELIDPDAKEPVAHSACTVVTECAIPHPPAPHRPPLSPSLSLSP